MRYILVLVPLFLGISSVVWGTSLEHSVAGTELSVKEKFEDLCKSAREESPSFSSDTLHVISASPAYQAIVAMGPRCLPYVMEKIRKEDVHKWTFVYVGAVILKIEPGPVVMGSSSRLQKYVEKKLVSGYQEAEEEFSRLNAEWMKEKGQKEAPELWTEVTVLDGEFKVLKTHKEFTPAGKVYSQIRSLGIFVLPSLMLELEKGNYDFLPIISTLSNGSAPTGRGYAKQGAKACITWWAKNKGDWTIRASEFRESSSKNEGDAGVE